MVAGDDEGVVADCYLLGVIPSRVGDGVAPDVDCFPEEVVAWVKVFITREKGEGEERTYWVERPTVQVEFVRKNQLIFLTIEGCAKAWCHCRWSLGFGIG
jgi:hypothetical protein